MYLKQIGDPDSSIEVYTELIKDCEENGMTPNLFCWDLSNAYFLKLDWNSSIKSLGKVVSCEKFHNLAVCKLELASALAMIDKVEEGKKLIEDIKTKGTNVRNFYNF